jgi:hypothetical protein
LVGDPLESVEEHRVRTTLFIYGEVAFEHAPFWPKSVDAMPYILAPHICDLFRSRCLGQAIKTYPIDTHAYSADLDYNVFVLCECFESGA